MKIAVSSSGNNIESEVDIRFGRCPYFIIVEVEDKAIKSFEALENRATAQVGGAGISAAEIVANKNVNAVISGNVGPKAFSVFQQFNIEVYKGVGTVKKAVEDFLEGKLEKIDLAGPMNAGKTDGMGMGKGMGRRDV